ncbi:MULTISPECIES: cupin domain-containing protein [unclassified Nocardioides]|uniref:cupin domain-containing protein n=1 Tax=Nocardioides sp. URHA0032 TaxID=1380388 RepID=UPI00055EE96C|nr:cupin domain-containing protein [Nocardioides sp. URHA0032]
MKRLLLPAAGLSLVAAGFGAGIAVSATAADDPAAPVSVTRQSLAEVPDPTGGHGRTLGLSKVVVMPGAQLASHHHPGSQLGYVAEGVLTYTVETKQAKLMKGSGDDPTLVKVIRPGMTVKVRPGQWLVEEQGEIHHARNGGDTPVILYLSTLLKTGEPAAIPD